MNRISVGTTTITHLSDGQFTLTRDLFPAADKTVSEKLPAQLNVFYIEQGTRKILIDTGAAKTFQDTLGHLPEALTAQHVSPADITDIFVTHGHLDHVGGLIDTAGNIVFKNAQISIHERELQFWFEDEIYNSIPAENKIYFDIARRSLTPYKLNGMIKTFKPNADMGGGIFAVDLPGHTPGHSGFRISDGNDQLLIWGDIVHIPSVQLAHPTWQMNFDGDAEQGIHTRTKTLAEVAHDHITVTGMHLPAPAFGNIETIGAGYRFTPRG
jgi:glyoxylase-like metal-dependent hydrolase (beta-lactamase superfamily II)